MYGEYVQLAIKGELLARATETLLISMIILDLRVLLCNLSYTPHIQSSSSIVADKETFVR